jgi:PEP-CTERM motif
MKRIPLLLAILAFAAPAFANSITIHTPPGGYLYNYSGTAEGFTGSFWDYTAFYSSGGITNGNITKFNSGFLELVNDQNFSNETVIYGSIFKGVFNSLKDTFTASFSGWEYTSAAGYVDVTGTYVVTGVNSYNYYGLTYGPQTHGTIYLNGGSPGGMGYSTVPEPGSLTLMGTGLLGLAGIVRRKLGRSWSNFSL